MPAFQNTTIKRAFNALTAILVMPLALSFRLRQRLIGEERAYLELSERAARWPGVRGERMRNALHRRLGTHIGQSCVLRFGTVLGRPPLSVGRMTVLGHYVTVQSASIGEDCVIGDHVVVTDGRRQHNIDRLDRPINAQGINSTHVRIGDDCWIGAHATILADVGDHSVVGAGSVVIEPVLDYTIVAGNPARVIGDRRELAAT